MITIKNSQRKIKFDVEQFKKNAQIILDALGYSDFDLFIWLTTNKTIHTYNKQYRNKDKPTDILSFPFYPHLKPGQRIKAKLPDEKNLGDIIISLEYVAYDAPRWNMTFDQRMPVLLVHGICHLLGYDHEKDKDFRVMKHKENALLKLIT